MKEESLPEFVTIEHPDVKGTAKVSREAFQQVLKAKGWKLATTQKADEGAKKGDK